MQFEMNAVTCQALVALFPLVMITLVLERRVTSRKITAKKWYRTVTIDVLGASLVGLAVSVWGCQTNGLDGFLAAVGWATAMAAVFGIGWALLASMATTEVLEDGPGDVGPEAM